MAKADVQTRGLVAELVLDAPPLNLVDAQLITDLEAAIARCAGMVRDGRARAVLLRAEGAVFCAGVDVHEFQGLHASQGSQLMSRFLTLVQTLEALPVPTIAVVHALNLTIGLELCLGCDMLWAAEQARFGLVEATVGLTPGAGGTQRFVARAGYARAAEFVMTGDLYDAAELEQWAVVNRVRPGDVLLAEARAFADRLAAGPTMATAAGKRLLQLARDHGVAAADAATAHVTGPIFETDDLVTGIDSLLSRGPGKATFTGR